MSSIDPALAAAQQFVQAAEEMMAEAALNLGAGADDIVAQLNVGDLFPAMVLAPQNGQDRLEIFGQPVAAQVPPGIHPGETIVLQVNGFDGSKILVSNLGVIDPENPPSLANVQPPPQPPAGAPVAGTLTLIPPPPEAPEDPTLQTQPQAAPQPRGSLPQTQQMPPQAPPREVFVAASVRPAPAPAEPIDIPAARVAAPVEIAIEARIAAARTATQPQSPAPTRIEIRPPIVPAQRASLPLSAILSPRTRPAAPVVATPVQRQQASSAPRDPFAAALEKIRVPVMPLTLAAARIAKDAVAVLPRAFARLDALLPKELPAAAAPLRTLLAFVGKLDLANVRALPEQIAAFVSHVAEGAEAKLAQALAEHRDAETPPQNTTANADAKAVPEDQTSPPQAAATARAAERVVALDYDVKTALIALSQSSGVRTAPELAQAINDALTAVTGVQVGTLTNAVNDPSAITISLPAFYHEGGRPAQMRIDRDAPDGGKPLDADNFRIGFILDTASLGTLAIDVETVGRTVRVDVRTERTRAAETINKSLPDLRTRFEQLRYRVAAMTAGVAPAASAATSATAPPVEQHIDPASGLDLRA